RTLALEHYSPNQLLILDGDQLRLDPVHVMEIVQRFLKAKPYYPYDKNLKYDPNKGFYCQVINDDHTKCLGRSKGRLYAAMEPNAEKALSAFYRADNVALASRLLAGSATPACCGR
ncbi:PREDICTED: bifunctional heparan sulfate N-deacetylase/N-sulfotransferase 4-like, partial [Priapulus caudatus]|uniref:Bifunctional heparan sulfate N-deacetylase/N-sulfotransferase 4-like n=1 Tax=Priapulus caudatus TaxID=37621 RepID=A0ABM1EVL7_PRICU